MNQGHANDEATSDPEPWRASKDARKPARKPAEAQNEELNRYFGAGTHYIRRDKLPDTGGTQPQSHEEHDSLLKRPEPSSVAGHRSTHHLSSHDAEHALFRDQPHGTTAIQPMQNTQQMISQKPSTPLHPIKMNSAPEDQLPQDWPGAGTKEVVIPHASKSHAHIVPDPVSKSRRREGRTSSREAQNEHALNRLDDAKPNDPARRTTIASFEASNCHADAMERPDDCVRDAQPKRSIYRDQPLSSSPLRTALETCAASLQKLERLDHTPNVVA